MFHKYLFFFSLFLFSSLTCFAEESSSSSFDLNTEDEMIADFYNHPEKIPEIDKICENHMKWGLGRFNLDLQQLYHTSILCYTWDINKKLSSEQINLLARFKSILSQTTFNITRNENYPIQNMVSDKNDLTLQILTKLYNIIYNKNLPECAFESKISEKSILAYQYWDMKPCNTDSELIKLCEQEKNMLPCMRQNLIDSFSKLVIPNQKNPAIQDINSLIRITDQFIQQIIPNESNQYSTIKNFYNLYWLVFHGIYNDVEYYANHD